MSPGEKGGRGPSVRLQGRKGPCPSAAPPPGSLSACCRPGLGSTVRGARTPPTQRMSPESGHRHFNWRLEWGEHPSPVLPEAPALLRFRRPGVLHLRPWAAASRAVRGARRAARPGESGREGRAPPAPRAARARVRSRTAGSTCGRGSAAGGAEPRRPRPPARRPRSARTRPPARAAKTPPTSPSSPAPRDLPGTPPGSSPLLRRARVALKVAEAREKVDQPAQGRRTWERGKVSWPARDPGAAVRACPSRAQTFVKEDAGDPERGEEQREVLTTVHSARGGRGAA